MEMNVGRLFWIKDVIFISYVLIQKLVGHTRLHTVAACKILIFSTFAVISLISNGEC